jgi:hypothetical protein
METDFLSWWFDTHYILSTLLTPFLMVLWAIWKGQALQGIMAVLVMILLR